MVTRVGLWGKSHELPAAIWTWNRQTDGSNLTEFWQYQHSASLFSSAVIFFSFSESRSYGIGIFSFPVVVF